jgi:tripartite-type tricarboxylate transporter receptor subunit TctC
MQFATIAPTLPLIRSGQLRALAVTGTSRSGTMPDTPTLAESGLPGYEATLWMAIMMPPATPPGIVGKLNRMIADALNTNEAKDMLLAQGVDTGQAPRRYARASARHREMAHRDRRGEFKRVVVTGNRL